MKKLIVLMALLVLGHCAMAQKQYFCEWNKGRITVVRTTEELDSITFGLPENAVDLGLPSGTIWADRNVGADSPEDYGDYFAWGETTPKETFGWSTYKWCNGSYNTLTKYCTYSSYGNVDDKRILELEDDAASVVMGRNWRMPSYEELRELSEQCAWKWTVQNKIKGYKVVGPNGNSIFLPAASCYISENDETPQNVGAYCNFWCSTLNKDEPWFAYNLDAYFGEHYVSNRVHRSSGLSIRAVLRLE